MTLAVKKMTELDLSGKRVLIRQDLNVPIKSGEITSDARIMASLPSIEYALSQGAGVILMSHLGRPTEGGSQEENRDFTLQPVADYLGKLLKKPVRLVDDYLRNAPEVNPGDVVLLENVRFNPGEKKDDTQLAKQYARLCDIFVMDAFGTAHRAQASTHGVARFAPVACAGPLLSAELEALEKALARPARPLVAIVAGAKVSTKLEVLNALVDKCDQLIVGGGIANTFLAASGKQVGKSLCEKDMLDTARQLMTRADIPLPTDVLTGKEFAETAIAELKSVDQVGDDDMIFDIGPQSSKVLAEILENAGTIIWNGPIGVFEFEQFSKGTEAIAKAVAKSPAFSIAGGGDTLAAVDKFGVTDRISYISTGGGAFLEYVEGKELPAVTVLKTRAND